MANPFDELEYDATLLLAALDRLPDEAKRAAHADIFADLLFNAGLDDSRALRLACSELMARAFGLTLNCTLAVQNRRGQLGYETSPEEQALASCAFLLLDDGDGEGGSGSEALCQVLPLVLSSFGARSFAEHWATELASGHSRLLFVDAGIGAGLRLVSCTRSKCCLRAFHRELDVSSLASLLPATRPPTLAALQPDPCLYSSSAELPSGRPLTELLAEQPAKKLPPQLACRSMGPLLRDLSVLRAHLGEDVVLGPFSARFAWWSEQGFIFLHHLGLERLLRDAVRPCTDGGYWQGPYSPEALQGRTETGAAVDVFYLAALCYHLLTGLPRPSGASELVVMQQMASGDWPGLDTLPSELASMLQRALGPAQQRPSISELASVFERVSPEETASARAGFSLEDPITRLEVSSLSARVFRHLKLSTLGELLQLSDEQFLSAAHALARPEERTAPALLEVKTLLANLGLSLRS